MRDDSDFQKLSRRLAVNISTERKWRGLTQYDLADKIGIKRATISFVERGTNNPSLYYLFKLSQFFDVPIWRWFEPRFVDPQKYSCEQCPFEDIIIEPQNVHIVDLAPYQTAWIQLRSGKVSLYCNCATENLSCGEAVKIQGPCEYRFVNYEHEPAHLLRFSPKFK